jgi:hypothetical protein
MIHSAEKRTTRRGEIPVTPAVGHVRSFERRPCAPKRCSCSDSSAPRRVAPNSRVTVVSLRALAAQLGPSHQLEICAKSLGMTRADEQQACIREGSSEIAESIKLWIDLSSG